MPNSIEKESVYDAVRNFPIRIKRILAPIDLGHLRDTALTYAVPIAAIFQAKITLIYVSPAQLMGTEFTHLPGEEESITLSAEERLRQFAKEKIPEAMLGELLVRQGVAYEAINDAAREKEIDVIIINTRGNTGLKRAILGSTTEHVIRSAPCQVIVVRE